ncbi:MAG: hypothetical protein P5702_02780 [Limnospira sp. PMC 1291.21]|uniref:Uncharacterized protein n=2 Tax=Limnospira TaxID=2596745 RepID=A0A9P1KIY2_9CYAN|nr:MULTISPECIES: hypothetical protein [Limnospira]EKD08178.1 hypothetical protein SPLC1_S271000 [Arthrospira platensis C1]MDC0840483.1 hypothetical protein [Limnoraphis robusta]MDY7052696.1 hypothetical protein [Limnospira fusiformis LS22]QJB25236.1 hypothetical protein HFV01_04770 [Limnospira fusiformis SAG 85.79]RAQ38875.1 hypothetical protein B9S53_24915 [Arthrospira sp. O9.13F]
MLTHHRKPVRLSWISTDLPLRSQIETAATLYQKDKQQFHLILQEPDLLDWQLESDGDLSPIVPLSHQPRLLWLEVSPGRAVMTMQGKSNFSYRHLWQKGMYGLSRYYLQGQSESLPNQIRLRNFTRDLTLVGYPLPEFLRLEYELWSEKLRLGNYVLLLEIHH